MENQASGATIKHDPREGNSDVFENAVARQAPDAGANRVIQIVAPQSGAAAPALRDAKAAATLQNTAGTYMSFGTGWRA
jgi:hypothetical protein